MNIALLWSLWMLFLNNDSNKVRKEWQHEQLRDCCCSVLVVVRHPSSQCECQAQQERESRGYRHVLLPLRPRHDRLRRACMLLHAKYIPSNHQACRTSRPMGWPCCRSWLEPRSSTTSTSPIWCGRRLVTSSHDKNRRAYSKPGTRVVSALKCNPHYVHTLRRASRCPSARMSRKLPAASSHDASTSPA